MDNERPLRILIIDDDRTDREICRQSLSVSSGLTFEFAETDSGAAGIAHANAWSPDCILLDYSLPDMDGLEVLTRLGTGSGQRPLPVVMLTAHGGEILAVQAMKAGAMDYLPKRHAGGEWLPRAVRNAVEKSRMQTQIEEQRAQLEQSAQGYRVLLEAMPQMVWTAGSQGCLEYANRRWLEYTDSEPGVDSRLVWERLVHPEDRDRTWSAWQEAVASGSAFEIEHRLRRASDGEYRWHLVRAVPTRVGTQEPARWFGTCTEIEDRKRAEELLHQRQRLESIGRLAGGIAHDFNNLLAVILGGASFVSDSLPGDHPLQGMLRDVVSSSERAAQLTRRLLAYAGKANQFVERIAIGQLVLQTCDGIRSSLPRTVSFELRNQPDLPDVETDLAQMRQVIADLVVNAAEALGAQPGTISVTTEVVEIDPGAAARNGLGVPEVQLGPHVAIDVQDSGCGMDEETQKKMFDPFFSTKETGRGLGLAGAQGFARSNRGTIQVHSTPGVGTRVRLMLPVALEANGAGMARH